MKTKKSSTRLLAIVAAATVVGAILAPAVVRAALSVKNYFDQPAGGSATDNVFHIGGTMNVESGGTETVKSGASSIIADGAVNHIGTSGTQYSADYAVFATLDPPSLATTCTNDYFTNNPAMSATYNFGTQPDGTSAAFLGKLAITDVCTVTSGTNETAALSHFCRVSTAGGGVANTTVVEVKTCTYGTVNGANQKLILNFKHMQ